MSSGGIRVSIFARSPPTSAGVGVWTSGARCPTSGGFAVLFGNPGFACGKWPTTALGTIVASSLPPSLTIASTRHSPLVSSGAESVT